MFLLYLMHFSLYSVTVLARVCSYICTRSVCLAVVLLTCAQLYLYSSFYATILVLCTQLHSEAHRVVLVLSCTYNNKQQQHQNLVSKQVG
jgi:hypothetical protein